MPTTSKHIVLDLDIWHNYQQVVDAVGDSASSPLLDSTLAQLGVALAGKNYAAASRLSYQAQEIISPEDSLSLYWADFGLRTLSAQLWLVD